MKFYLCTIKPFDIKNLTFNIFISGLPQVIVEKAEGEKNLPDLDRTKFIVPDDMSLTQFSAIVRYGISFFFGINYINIIITAFATWLLLQNKFIHMQGNSEKCIHNCTLYSILYHHHLWCGLILKPLNNVHHESAEIVRCFEVPTIQR